MQSKYSLHDIVGGFFCYGILLYFICHNKFGQLFLESMGFKVVILQKFPILHNHLYYSICWLQADVFFKTVPAISLVFFTELDTNFCFFCSFHFGAFNPVSAIAGNIFLRFFSCAVEAIHFSNSFPPVTFIVRLVLLGILVSPVACGFCFLLSDN